MGNRLQFALLREALHIVQSGAADAETVDRVMRASLGRRYAMVGPLEAADMGGLDTFRDIASHLWPTLARDEAPLQLLEDQVAAAVPACAVVRAFTSGTRRGASVSSSAGCTSCAMR